MQEQSTIHFPEYWDTLKVIEAFKTKSTLELYAYFGCANATSFTRMMKPIFPSRPSKMSYSAYVLKCLEDGTLNPVTNSITITYAKPFKIIAPPVLEEIRAEEKLEKRLRGLRRDEEY